MRTHVQDITLLEMHGISIIAEEYEMNGTERRGEKYKFK